MFQQIKEPLHNQAPTKRTTENSRYALEEKKSDVKRTTPQGDYYANRKFT